MLNNGMYSSKTDLWSTPQDFYDELNVLGRAEIRFVRGRLKFGGSKNSAPFPSMVAVFRPRNNTEELKNV